MRLRKTKRSQLRRGAVAVEMAMTVPLLLFIVFSAYEFSRANMIRHTVESAAYEGARNGILPGATEQNVKDGANSILSSIGTRDAQITVAPLPLTDDDRVIEVTISVELRKNMFFAPFFFRESVITRKCRMSREELF